MHGLPRTSLVLDHLWIVDKFVVQYSRLVPRGVGADLAAAGRLGLVEAAERFDPRRRLRFSTYAWTWVKGAVLAELRRCHVVPVAEWTARKDKREGKAPRVVVVFGALDDGGPASAPGEVDDQEATSDRSMRLRGLQLAATRLDDPNHRRVIEGTLRGRTPEQIALTMGLGDERVRQLLKEATALLAEDMWDEMCEAREP